MSTNSQSARISGGAAAAGVIPKGLPAKMAVGLFEDSGSTWMQSSGVRWDVRYRYLTKGWSDNWGWGARDGWFALDYFQQSDAQGFVPAVQYYQMNGEPGGWEGQFLQKAQNASTMRSYFEDFKLLMVRAKEFGKPVHVLLEADGFGFLEQQSGDNPNVYAAVADTGMPELAGLPNTVAGWSLAFLQLRRAAGADNAVLGMHISAWASGQDLAHFSLSSSISEDVNKVYSFLKPLGLGSNVTGQTYDVLVGDPLDRDAQFYATLGQDRWWDPSDNAPLDSKSFNRYAEWLRVWNQTAGKRWVLWQIPAGNSNHLDVPNAGGPRQGYRDNRPEYFFGPGRDAHLQKFADAGVIALLFGAGTGGQSTYDNDYYTDGQLFLKSRVGDFVAAGGMSLAASGSVVDTPTTPPLSNPPPSRALCTPSRTITGGWSGNFDTTGPICLQLSGPVNGWGCSWFEGRTLKVNGAAISCGDPLPPAVDGSYVFDVSAGNAGYANLWWW